MKYNVTAKCFEYNPPKELEFKVESPGTCPRCNLAWQPHCVCAVYTELDDDNEDEYYVDVMWLCPNCKETSISNYDSYSDPDTRFTGSFPNAVPETEFYGGIKELSPSFVKIYHEALTAERCNLFEIAGMGYRKALEFLIKDYAIKNNPADKEIIATTDLSACIKKYIANPRAEAVIKRTVWIGNDQVHYVKLHTNLDLEDLKALLNLSLSYITMELQTDEAMKIPSKSHKKAATADRGGGKD